MILFVFDFNSGALSYISTAEREDTAAALVEWLGNLAPEILKQAMERWESSDLERRSHSEPPA